MKKLENQKTTFEKISKDKAICKHVFLLKLSLLFADLLITGFLAGVTYDSFYYNDNLCIKIVVSLLFVLCFSISMKVLFSSVKLAEKLFSEET